LNPDGVGRVQGLTFTLVTLSIKRLATEVITIIPVLLFFAGLTAFDFISDFEEWIECGYFSEEIKARLKGVLARILVNPSGYCTVFNVYRILKVFRWIVLALTLSPTPPNSFAYPSQINIFGTRIVDFCHLEQQ